MPTAAVGTHVNMNTMNGANKKHSIRAPHTSTTPTSTHVSNLSSHGHLAGAAITTAALNSQRRKSSADRPYFPPMSYKGVPTELTLNMLDDWEYHGSIPGEKLVMKIEEVYCARESDTLVNLSLKPTLNSPADAIANPLLNVVGSVPGNALVGTFVMTSYQIYLEPVNPLNPTGDESIPIEGIIAVPLSTIERLDLPTKKPQSRLSILDVVCKDGRLIHFGFSNESMIKRAVDCLMMYIFPTEEKFLYAFFYKIKCNVPYHLNGWNLYNPVKEFKRLGLPNHALRLYTLNKDYEISPTYPSVFCIPNEQLFTNDDLLAVAKFRSRGRVPACVWAHPTGSQTIWRSSQPRVGMNGARSLEDEKMLMAISTATGVREVAIFDCRPKMNAQANKLAGKGFESSENYKNCKIYFMNIENIHVMRESYNNLVKACQTDRHSVQFSTALAQSNWLYHVGEILKATFQMLLAIDRDRVSILNHCSDGWDRTAQLCSLTEMCLDPYYRTTIGFCVLIEKEWLSFGHQFHKRLGHGSYDSLDERSPVFLQFLDCVYQITIQFPRHFEFNSHFLVTLMDHVYSCRFGTFFYDSEKKRHEMKLSEKTASVWTYFFASPAACRGDFTNPLYAPNGRGDGETIAHASIFKKDPLKRDESANHDPKPESSLFDFANEPVVATSLQLDASAAQVPADESVFSFIEESPASTSVTLSTETEATLPIRSSVGRGGGNNSTEPSGTVLYPTFSMKKLVLWSDYFLRFHSDQTDHTIICGPLGGGLTPPGGVVTSSFTSNEGLLQKHLRKEGFANSELQQKCSQLEKEKAELEAQLAALKAQLHAQGTSSLTVNIVAPPADISTTKREPEISTATNLAASNSNIVRDEETKSISMSASNSEASEILAEPAIDSTLDKLLGSNESFDFITASDPIPAAEIAGEEPVARVQEPQTEESQSNSTEESVEESLIAPQPAAAPTSEKKKKKSKKKQHQPDDQ